MKTPFLSIALFLLVLCPRVRAADIPELEEWFSIVNQEVGFGMSYLPDFDTANNGRNATGIFTFRSGPTDQTWYNRSKGDTVNQFTWPGQSVPQINQGDFDGDGVLDYLTYDGHIHKGTQNGVPPPSTPVAYYHKAGGPGTIPRIIMDVDNDGYDDVIMNDSYNSGGHWLMSFLFGGPDLTKLKLTITFERKVNTEFLVGVLPQKSVEGKVRIVTRSYQDTGFQKPKWVSYVLREIDMHKNGDSMEVSLTTLDSISDAGMRPQQYYDMFEGIIHQSRSGEPVHLLVPVWGGHRIENYVLDNGKFEKVQEFAPIDNDIRFPVKLNESINGDRYIEWMTAVTIAGKGSECMFHAGMKGKKVDSVAFAKVKFICPVTEDIKIEAIGDVTGDGVGDLAMAFNNDFGCFVIYKGVSSHTVSVAEQQPGASIPPSFSMQQNYPNPVGSERRMTVPVEVQKAETFTLELYTLDGRKIAELFNGFMPVGRSEFTFDLKPYNLSGGFYSLRMSNGVRLRERGVLLR